MGRRVIWSFASPCHPICSVCGDALNIYNIPIFECLNGHLACPDCCEKPGSFCSVCETPLFLELPCPNAEFGCPEEFDFHLKSNHADQCLFTQCPCPLISCDFSGSYKDLYDHIVTKHSDSLQMFECGEEGLSFDSGDRLVIKENSAKGGELVVVESFRLKDNDKLFCARCIAPIVSGVGNFEYEMTWKDLKLTSKFMRRVRGVSGEPPASSYMVVPRWMGPAANNLLKICINRGNYENL